MNNLEQIGSDLSDGKGLVNVDGRFLWGRLEELMRADRVRSDRIREIDVFFEGLRSHQSIDEKFIGRWHHRMKTLVRGRLP